MPPPYPRLLSFYLFPVVCKFQNDVQAQARCHRIGQTKSVKVREDVSAKDVKGVALSALDRLQFSDHLP